MNSPQSKGELFATQEAAVALNSPAPKCLALAVPCLAPVLNFPPAHLRSDSHTTRGRGDTNSPQPITSPLATIDAAVAPNLLAPMLKPCARPSAARGSSLLRSIDRLVATDGSAAALNLPIPIRDATSISVPESGDQHV